MHLRTRGAGGPFTGRFPVAWDGLRMQERRFEGVMIEGKDPVEEIDKKMTI